MPKRADTNQPAIVTAMRQTGYTVHHTYELGKGFPDLLVSGGRLGDRNVLVEVKGERGTLTPQEEAFFREWPGEKYVVRSVDEWLRLHESFLSKESRS
jgi:hypothetical protein